MSVDLSTTYLGLTLANPLVASSGPLTGSAESLKKLEEAGIAAAVMPSLFEEEIEHDVWQQHKLQQFGSESFAEALDYFPAHALPGDGPDAYLRRIAAAKQAVSIPIIASLNGTSPGGWTGYARQMEEAGADALELNVYFMATDPDVTGAEVEERYLELVGSVRTAIGIPLSVKIGPFFSCLPNIAGRLVEAGADGLVLFNRFLQPDINLDSLAVEPRMSLSSEFEMRLPLRWIAVLRGQLVASLAATSGVYDASGMAKLLLAGADVTMTTAALLQQGPQYASRMIAELSAWMAEREYVSVRQLQGSMSCENCPNPDAYERVNYLKALISYTGSEI
ncbi:NAD-dependent dihydropyrimidine dehydrogenase subunit PreA [Maioricimonas rarisocia]|uniref:NAD-dependent dihydropyrimidine dehydrogenase subunit PreA n=1 Tax=Maioricimonas rarisocia TaxID=2528026 RepID=A0A517ZF08_9PLAN|nr:dihydroorotate dehydrogenase-like protein [Maioricimonas rarisocia]QDU41046.1 NAD-dependent dihydropyrimidine dehydrogenase subunit PreA [Maioricimonas rarisocia]